MSFPLPMPRLPVTIKCPHCGITFKGDWSDIDIGYDPDGARRVRHTTCAACNRLIAELRHYTFQVGLGDVNEVVLPEKLQGVRMIRPRTANRKPIPADLPKAIADDYTEAANVLPESAKASAALSRRALQSLLVEKAGAKKKDLFDQIQEVLDADILPTDLAEDLDSVRAIGAFGAHPIKSKSTGEIVPVEPGEAEWNLDVLDELFEFFYVRPKARDEKRAALDRKLTQAGKPTLAEMRKKPRE